MFIQTIPVGVFRCNCSIIACESTRQAIVIDPGDEPERILEAIGSNRLEVTRVVHTHGHIDHIMGTFGVVEETGAIPCIHQGDKQLWDNIDLVAASFGIPTPKIPSIAAFIEHGETLPFGTEQVRVIHTPGHTAGSCCLLLNLKGGKKVLFSGDTLFRGKIGIASPYPDPNSNGARLVSSIRNRLFALDDDTRVIPGHGPETSIGIERRTNPFVSPVSGSVEPVCESQPKTLGKRSQ
jgi:hydroxyacylglutathione hydrolase